jgi:hypothetical protein
MVLTSWQELYVHNQTTLMKHLPTQCYTASRQPSTGYTLSSQPPPLLDRLTRHSITPAMQALLTDLLAPVWKLCLSRF